MLQWNRLLKCIKIYRKRKRATDLQRAIMVSQLSYEDWVKFQRGELKIGNANNLSFFDKLIGAFKKQNKLNYEK